MNLTYLRYELIRSVRNKRAFIFSLIFPLVLFYVVAGANRHIKLEGIPFPTYYLAGMASFGTMVAMTSVGARIAAERQAGWNRQLRLTPLSTRAYMRAKVLTGYLTALITLILLFIAGATLGVHLTTTNVLRMTELVLLGLIPFAALGILIGHLLRRTQSVRSSAVAYRCWRCLVARTDQSAVRMVRCMSSRRRRRHTGWCRRATRWQVGRLGRRRAGSPWALGR
jgi:ABC-type multidrug transport system permease subunit